MVDPLALFGVIRNQGGIKITLDRQLANPDQPQHHGHAGNGAGDDSLQLYGQQLEG